MNTKIVNNLERIYYRKKLYDICCQSDKDIFRLITKRFNKSLFSTSDRYTIITTNTPTSTTKYNSIELNDMTIYTFKFYSRSEQHSSYPTLRHIAEAFDFNSINDFLDYVDNTHNGKFCI
jgi:hypothetical protein